MKKEKERRRREFLLVDHELRHSQKYTMHVCVYIYIYCNYIYILIESNNISLREKLGAQQGTSTCCASIKFLSFNYSFLLLYDVRLI
jgi:hypothetical protein